MNRFSPFRFFVLLAPLHTLSFVLLLLFLPSTMSGKDEKEIRPGALWLDNRGQHINAHGGGFLYDRGCYYWFGEHKSDTTNVALVGVNCYSSKNLTDWTYRGVALSVVDENGHDLERGCIVERPKVIYNHRTRQYVMWFHLELKGRGYSAARYGVAVASRPEGPYRFLRSGRVNPGHYPTDFGTAERAVLDTINPARYAKWWTPTWRRAVEQGLFIERDLHDHGRGNERFLGGQMARDMTLFVDDNGTAYHIYSSEENLTLHIAELTDDYLAHTGRYVRVAPGDMNEAPALFKHRGRYWMITSGCTGWAPNAARLFTATDIMGPWTKFPNPCVGEGSEKTFGGQGTFVLPLAGKKDAFIFMADIWRPEHPSDSRYLWLPIRFDQGIPVVEWREHWNLRDAFGH